MQSEDARIAATAFELWFMSFENALLIREIRSVIKGCPDIEEAVKKLQSSPSMNVYLNIGIQVKPSEKTPVPKPFFISVTESMAKETLIIVREPDITGKVMFTLSTRDLVVYLKNGTVVPQYQLL